MFKWEALEEMVYKCIKLLEYSKIRLMMASVAVVMIGVIWGFTLYTTEYEYRTEVGAIKRVNSNLAKSFEENVRRNLQDLDKGMLFLKEEYETHGKITPAMMNRMEVVASVPVIHISIIDENGRIVSSPAVEKAASEISDREYFKVHKEVSEKDPYFSRSTGGHVVDKWLFHISRRLNKPDGSFAGVVAIGIEPSYFSNFYRRMALGKSYGISVVGEDSFIKVRQASEQMDTDIRSVELFQHVGEMDVGSYADEVVVDNIRQIVSYQAMPDYPFVLSVSVVEAEALGDYYRRRDEYCLASAIVSVVIIGIFWLLIWMVGQNEKSKEALRVVNEQLEVKVEQRTRDLQEANEELQRISMLDGLTGIANRRCFDEYLERAWHTAIRQDKPLAILMADIDYFKEYNDTYGHQLGDECLKKVAIALQTVKKRAADMVARYGGEEFVIILPDTEVAGGMTLAEKLRIQVSRFEIEHSESPFGRVTISLGVAALVPDQEGSSMGIVNLADQALYEAKWGGRNCTKKATLT